MLIVTDKEIMDWLEREGLESIIRCPQFDRTGASLGVNLWKSHWKPDEVYVTMRQAAITGMEASKVDNSGGYKTSDGDPCDGNGRILNEGGAA